MLRSVLATGLLLLVWGVISFRALPVEAYPDVANNYVQIITQWPGRAAEEVEQQVTIPIEVRRELQIEPGSKLAFVIGEPGKVELRPASYPTIASLRGAAGSLSNPLSWKDMLEIGREDAVAAKRGGNG